MSLEVNWEQSSAYAGHHIQTQEGSNYVMLSVPSLTAEGLPNDGTLKFAALAYVVNPSTQNISLSAGDLNIDLTSTDAILNQIDDKTPAYSTAGTPSADVSTIQGSLSAYPVAVREYQKATVPSSASIQTAAGDIFTLNLGEKGFIRNLGTNPLFFRLATGASTSAFHDVLVPGATNDDGYGGAVIIDDHVGIVSVAGTSPRFIAWKK